MTVGSVDVGADRVINATFVMPVLQPTYSGNGVGPCLAVTIPSATDRGERFVSPLFAKPRP